MPRLGRSKPARGYVLIRPVANFAPVSVAQADAAGAVDSMAEAVAAPQADVAAAVEAMAIALAESDVAGAVDSMAEAVTAPQADAAGAVDSMAEAVTAPQADVGAAVESMSLLIGPQQADAAGAVESMSVAATAPSADVGAGVEALTVAATAPSADVAGATDKMAIGLPQADVAGAAESMVIGIASADVAGAVEALAEAVTAPQHDVAGAVDAMAIVAGGPSTFISAFPGGGGQYVLPPGYAGGPSGAGHISPSALGNGWEIYVLSGTDYVTLLAQVPATMMLSFQFVRQLSDIGSGTVVLSLDDPWWTEVTLPGGLPSSTLLDEECLWRFYKDGVARHEFLGETITEQLVDPSEQRTVTVTGPGTAASLKWAMVAPQGFPNIVLKLDGILDSFDEVDVNGNPVLDTNIWTTVSPPGCARITPVAALFSYPGGVGYNLGTLMPSGSVTITATAGTSRLGASPYDGTDTLISAQITPIGVSSTATDSTTPAVYGAGLDGSEVTQFYIQSNLDPGNYAMFGLSASVFYAQIGGSGEVVTAFLPPYDPSAHSYWMITEQAGTSGGSGTFYWWTSPDGQNWTLLWQWVHAWDARNMSFNVTATYDTAGQSVQMTNLNSMVTTPSYQGSIYLGLPLMGVWSDQFQKAQARGTVPFITTQFTAAADSYGRSWVDIQNVQAVNGTDLYTLLQSGTAVVNADFRMDPGFQLFVGRPVTGQVGLGTDRSGYLILRDGHDVMSRVRIRQRDQIVTLLGGENADGHEIAAFSPSFITEWGQREGWFQAAVQVDPTSLAYASAAALAQKEDQILSWTFTLVPNLPGKTIFDNFDVGDWVGLERPDFSAVDRVRVVGIAVQVDNTGAETHELTFLSYIQWLAQQLTYLANKLGGAFVNVQGTTPVAQSKYGTGQVPTYFTPAATLGALGDVAGSSAGSTLSSAPLVYNPATGRYQHAGTTDPVSGGTLPVSVMTASGSVTVTDTTVVVITGSGTTKVGIQPDGTVTTVDSGGSAPGVPDTPSVTATVQGITVTWDGLLGGVAPLSNFMYTEFHVSTTSGFTPSPATLVSTQAAGASISITGLLPGTTYYARLEAVTTAGVHSAASTQASATAAGLPTTSLTGQLPASLLGNSAGSWALNPNPFFNGGDLTGWTVSNGALAAFQPPPAGAPGAPAWCARIISTSSNCLISGTTAPFPTTPGQPYVMTAWVYNPSGSAVNVAIGFNWTAGTTTISCPAGTWTPLSTVQFCPGGVTSAYQVLGPTASGVTVYVTAAVAAAQVPGQLLAVDSVTANQIAAGTITATQIAASTITAAQIAANTITAGQIAANTITAAQIAAATITGTQIAASISLTSPSITGGTITGGSFIADGSSGEILVYSGTPASGNLVGGWSAVAFTDSHGNAVPAGLSVGAASNGPQVVLVPSAGGPGSPALVQFPIGGAFIGNQPSIGALVPSSTGQLFVSGPSLSQVGFRDWIQLGLISTVGGGGSYAALHVTYVDDSQTRHNWAVMDPTGINLLACNAIVGVVPATVSPTSPAVPETWHTPTLLNSWTAATGKIGNVGVRYRWIPWGIAGATEIEADLVSPVGVTGNSVCAQLPAGYIPPNDRNRDVGWGAFPSTNDPPWLFIDHTNGNLQVTGIQTAAQEMWFHVILPLD